MNYANDKSKIYLNLVLFALTAFFVPYILSAEMDLVETAIYLVLLVLFILARRRRSTPTVPVGLSAEEAEALERLSAPPGTQAGQG